MFTNDTFLRMARSKTAELSFVVLDVMDLFMLDFESLLQSDDCHNDFMALVFEVLYQLLTTDQSRLVVERMLQGTLRLFVHRFSSLFFVGAPEFTERLCQALIRYCNSMVREVHSKASAFLYFLMKENYEDRQSTGFSRVKVRWEWGGGC